MPVGQSRLGMRSLNRKKPLRSAVLPRDGGVKKISSWLKLQMSLYESV